MRSVVHTDPAVLLRPCASFSESCHADESNEETKNVVDSDTTWIDVHIVHHGCVVPYLIKCMAAKMNQSF